MLLQVNGNPWIEVLLFLWPLYVLIAVWIVLQVGLALYKRQRLKRSGIFDIDQMDGKTFEHYLAVLFTQLGYGVERTRYRGDYGGDLVISRAGEKTVVQAKRYQKSVGVKAIQEVVAAKGYYDCAKAMVVTNSTYTKQAVVLARANGVELWDRDRLVKQLLTTKKS